MVNIKSGSKKFKILELSNAVFSPSGYGVQSAGMLYDWVKYYDVRQLSNYGLAGRMIALPEPMYGRPDEGYVKGTRQKISVLPIYPNLPNDDHGDKTAEIIFRTWKPDVFVTLYDIWMGAYVREHPQTRQLIPIHPHWIPIIMVDHQPVPEATIINARAAYRVVTPTIFGVEQLQKFGVNATYIPFGIHTKVFKPSEDKKADKVWLDKKAVSFNIHNQTSIDEDSFVIIINGANKDPYRKAFMRMFIAIQLFLQNNPDAKKYLRVYVHSWMKMARDIPHGAKTLHIDEYCKGAGDYHMLCGVPAPAMVRMYGAGDVFLHLSQGGGFEIPILEAMSCGVPVIASDFVGMPELVKGHGWLIPAIKEGNAQSKYFTPLNALQIVVNEEKAAEALEDAYNHPEKRVKLGEEGRKFALGFDWKKVNLLWHKLFEEMRDEWRPKSLSSRRL